MKLLRLSILIFLLGCINLSLSKRLVRSVYMRSNKSIARQACFSQKLYSCEGNEFMIACPSNTPINIFRVNYGRTDSNICNGYPFCGGLGVFSNTNCISDQTEYFRNLCNGKTTCISKIPSNLGDPCIYTYKYFDIDYACGSCSLNLNRKYAYVCEDSSRIISCPHPQILRIINVKYGRTNKNICIGGDNCLNLNVFLNANCYSDQTQYFINLCWRQGSCKIELNSGSFSDPCPRVPKIFVPPNKYLSIEYECVDYRPY